jgi:hypothetical protein
MLKLYLISKNKNDEQIYAKKGSSYDNLVSTTNIKDALILDEDEADKFFLKLNPKTKKRWSYVLVNNVVQEIQTQEKETKQEETIFSDQSFDYAKIFSTISRIANDVDIRIQQLHDEVETEEHKQAKFLEEIQDMKFNASQGYSLYKELKDIREKRRKAKDELQHIQIFKTSAPNKYDEVEQKLKQSESTRDYKPRKYTALFHS